MKLRYLDGIVTDHLRELTYFDRKALHNFKYFTWVEQQGRSAEELRTMEARVLAAHVRAGGRMGRSDRGVQLADGRAGLL